MSINQIARENYIHVNGTEPPNVAGPVFDATMDFVFGKVWNSKQLSWREKRIISLTCTAISGHPLPLEAHVRGALNSGELSVEDIQAFALHLATYAGFPMAAAVELMLQKVLAEKNKPGS
jgi:4-carboxymuconolactone decarboxylase